MTIWTFRATISPARPPSPGSPGSARPSSRRAPRRSEEHTSELQSQSNLVCRLLLEKKKNNALDDDALATFHHDLHDEHPGSDVLGHGFNLGFVFRVSALLSDCNFLHHECGCSLVEY